MKEDYKMQKTCDKCGSIYELEEHKIMSRDNDSLDCDICGHKLISWNGGCIWTSKLIKKGKLPQIKSN